MKNYLSLLLVLAIVLLGQSLWAQSSDQPVKEEKKIVIIKKSIDEDGNEVTEKIIRTGAEAEEFEMDQDLDGTFIIKEEGTDGQRHIRVITDGEDLDIEESREVNVEVKVDGDAHSSYVITIGDETGETEVITWEGEGRLPEDIRQDLIERGIELHEFRTGTDEGNRTIRIEVEEGVEGSETVEKQIVIIEDQEEMVEGKQQRKKVIKRTKTVVKDGEVISEDISEVPTPVVEDALMMDEIDIFPNPSEGKVQVRFSAEAVPTTIKVMDVSGKTVYTEKIDNFDGQYDKTLDLDMNEAGTLILQVIQGENVMTGKIVIQ